MYFDCHARNQAQAQWRALIGTHLLQAPSRRLVRRCAGECKQVCMPARRHACLHEHSTAAVWPSASNSVWVNISCCVEWCLDAHSCRFSSCVSWPGRQYPPPRLPLLAACSAVRIGTIKHPQTKLFAIARACAHACMRQQAKALGHVLPARSCPRPAPRA